MGLPLLNLLNSSALNYLLSSGVKNVKILAQADLPFVLRSHEVCFLITGTLFMGFLVRISSWVRQRKSSLRTIYSFSTMIKLPSIRLAETLLVVILSVKSHCGTQLYPVTNLPAWFCDPALHISAHSRHSTRCLFLIFDCYKGCHHPTAPVNFFSREQIPLQAAIHSSLYTTLIRPMFASAASWSRLCPCGFSSERISSSPSSWTISFPVAPRQSALAFFARLWTAAFSFGVSLVLESV